MNNLLQEMNKFWGWAGITPEEYGQGIAPEFARQAEWEDDYPGWQKLDYEINRAIDDLSNKWNVDLAKLIVLSIAMDNEDGLVMDNCLERLADSSRLIEMCCRSSQPYARLEIALRVDKLTIPENLKLLLRNDRDERVSQTFLGTRQSRQ